MVQMLLSPRVTQLPQRLSFLCHCLGCNRDRGQVTCLSLAGCTMDVLSSVITVFHDRGDTH